MKKTLVITYDPDKCGGALIVGDTRLPVETVLDTCLNGYTSDELVDLYDIEEDEAFVFGKLVTIIEGLR